MVAQVLKESTGTGDTGVRVVCVDDLSVADDVVSNDDGAGARELDCPCQVDRIVRLVGVEEDEVEGLDLFDE